MTPHSTGEFRVMDDGFPAYCPKHGTPRAGFCIGGVVYECDCAIVERKK